MGTEPDACCAPLRLALETLGREIQKRPGGHAHAVVVEAVTR